MLSRRKFFGVLARALWVASAGRASGGRDPELRVDDLVAENCALLRRVTRQGYRADAAISVAGIPIFSRTGVGSAFLILGEGSHNERTISTLHLAGGSRPERTHGLEYFGSIKEAIVEQSSYLAEAAYFSFVTTRPEESFEDARRRILS